MYIPSAGHSDFAEDAEVLVVGIETDLTLQSKYPRARFWPAEAIHRASDIPEKVMMICISTRLLPGEFRTVENFARERGIRYICRESSLVSLRDRLDTAFKLKQNGNFMPAAMPPPLAPNSEPAQPAATNRHMNFRNKGVREFVAKHGDFSATKPTAEARRLVMLAAQEGILTTQGAVYQEFHRQKKQRQEAEPNQDKFIRLAAPQRMFPTAKKLAFRIESVMADLKRQYEQRVVVLSGLLSDVRALEEENIRLQEDNHNLRREIEKSKSEMASLREDGATLREMQRLMAKKSQPRP